MSRRIVLGGIGLLFSFKKLLDCGEKEMENMRRYTFTVGRTLHDT